MSFLSTTSVVFPLSAEAVFRELSMLDQYPLWNSGMISISKRGPMHEGMLFETASVVLGQTIKSLVEVKHLVPNQEIELVNNTGAITYWALFRFIETSPDHTEVTFTIRFEFKSIVLNLAKPTVEATAANRTKGDLEFLRGLMLGSADDMKKRPKLET
jgi:ribosome-associated toxin RatA of RatAB toxin-antitoxin module